MIKTAVVYILLPVLLVPILLASCEQIKDPCLLPTTAPVRFGTYQPADTGHNGKDYTLNTPIIGSADTNIAYYWGKNNKFFVSLNPLKDSSRWYIIPDSTKIKEADTLTFYYSRSLHFVSNACGYMYDYSLKNVTATNHLIDSVVIKNYDIKGDANVENVKVFY